MIRSRASGWWYRPQLISAESVPLIEGPKVALTAEVTQFIAMVVRELATIAATSVSCPTALEEYQYAGAGEVTRRAALSGRRRATGHYSRRHRIRHIRDLRSPYELSGTVKCPPNG
jgi:hypothetical protein